MRRVEVDVCQSDLPDEVKRLRTNSLKEEREARYTAIFAHGLATVMQRKVLVSRGEIADADFAVAWDDGTGQHAISMFQLKELTEMRRNPRQTLEGLLSGLQR